MLRRFSCKFGSSVFCFEFQLSVNEVWLRRILSRLCGICRNSVPMDYVDSWFLRIVLRVVIFFVDALQLPLSVSCGVPQVPLGLWVRSGREGAVVATAHPECIPGVSLISILTVKRILLLALISSRTAAVGIRSGFYVVGRSGQKGHPAIAGRSIRGSIGLGHRRCVCHPGSGER